MRHAIPLLGGRGHGVAAAPSASGAACVGAVSRRECCLPLSQDGGHTGSERGGNGLGCLWDFGDNGVDEQLGPG